MNFITSHIILTLILILYFIGVIYSYYYFNKEVRKEIILLSTRNYFGLIIISLLSWFSLIIEKYGKYNIK